MPSHGGSSPSLHGWVRARGRPRSPFAIPTLRGGLPARVSRQERPRRHQKARAIVQKPRGLPSSGRANRQLVAKSTVMSTKTNPGPLILLKDTWSKLRAVFGRILLAIIVWQIIMSVVAFPLIRWVFTEALRANGMYGIDLDDVMIGDGFPITVLLLIVMVLIVLVVLILQFGTYMVLLRHPGLTWRQLAVEVGRLARKTVSPPSLKLAFYLLVVLPLSGFGFTSAALHSVAVPRFITGELEKELSGQILLIVAYTLLGYLNLRLCLTLPIFAFSDEGGSKSIKTSWRLTKGLKPWTILVAAFITVVAYLGALTAVFFAMLVPTVISDWIAPGASPVVAALSFGVAEVLVLIVSGLAVAVLAGVLITFASNAGVLRPVRANLRTPSSNPLKIGLATSAVLAVVLGISAIPAMNALSDHPETIIIAHRGWTQGGVENTIEALEAANQAGAEIVEFDTMQTKDGKFVVMHDTNLARLTGQNVNVKDLTLDELTAMTVHAGGMSGSIPSLVDYVTRANELDQQLLIEIKLSGAETDTHVQDVVDLLQDNDLLDNHLFHTLDHQSAQDLKTILPDSTVGYIMPFAGFGLPQTLADFLVLEESSATSSMQDRTGQEGLGYVVWTVNTEEGIRLRLRESVDAIITDHPDWALEAREEMVEETGFAGRLYDLMLSFVFPN